MVMKKKKVKGKPKRVEPEPEDDSEEEEEEEEDQEEEEDIDEELEEEVTIKPLEEYKLIDLKNMSKSLSLRLSYMDNKKRKNYKKEELYNNIKNYYRN